MALLVRRYRLAAPARRLAFGSPGATFSDPAGKDTSLRACWNNQAIGLVADEVFEMKMEPANWGQIVFE